MPFVRGKKDLCIGVDVGKTKIAAGIVTSKGKIIAKASVPTDTRGKAVVEQIRFLIQEILQKSKVQPKGIGVGSSGIVDHKKGIVISSGSIPTWKNIRLKNLLGAAFGLPIFVENDVNAAALGECLYGAGRGAETAVFVIIGTGVGFCTINKRRIWHGTHGLAGQIGHLPLFGSAKTVNEVLGGRGISERVSSALGRPITTEEAFRLAAEKNPSASRIIEEAIRGTAVALAWVQNTIDPDLIIVGGGVPVRQKDFISLVRMETEGFLAKYRARLKNNLKIVPALLGNDAGIAGAAALCINQSFEE